MSKNRRALALISGGLDSMLAAKLIQNQGVHVEGINFYTGFCIEHHTSSIRNKKPTKNHALITAETLGIDLHIVDIAEQYKKIVTAPKHGYGKHLNPCLDCKIFMVQQAEAWQKENNDFFDFIITGEVVGQRPNSQLKHKLGIIARESGINDKLLRPLSAKCLPPTLPERELWVDREKLLGLTGRSRKPQIELAKQFDIEYFAQPAGGCCFLTDENYSRKLKDMWNAREKKDYSIDDALLLKVGRHLRPTPDLKLILGREDSENQFLESFQSQYPVLQPIHFPGSTAVIDGKLSEANLTLAAKIAARYGQGKNEENVEMQLKYPNGTQKKLTIKPFEIHEIKDEWII